MSQWKDIPDILLLCFQILDTFFLIYVGQELINGLRKVQGWNYLPLLTCVCVFLEKGFVAVIRLPKGQWLPSTPKFKNYWLRVLPPHLLLQRGRISILTQKSSAAAYLDIQASVKMCCRMVTSSPSLRSQCPGRPVKMPTSRSICWGVACSLPSTLLWSHQEAQVLARAHILQVGWLVEPSEMTGIWGGHNADLWAIRTFPNSLRKVPHLSEMNPHGSKCACCLPLAGSPAGLGNPCA